MNEGGRTSTDRPTGASAVGRHLPVDPAEDAPTSKTHNASGRVAHGHGRMVDVPH